MKKFFIFLFIVSPCFANAQDQHLIPKEKWSKEFYIPDEFCAARGLHPGETNGLIRVWNGESKKNGIMRLVDIRWYFNSPAEASEYLKRNMSELSESGDPVKTTIKIKDVPDLYVFSEGAGYRKLNETLGISSYMYYFLFIVQNYVAKVFVSTEKQIPVSEAAAFAQEAAKRLIAATR